LRCVVLLAGVRRVGQVPFWTISYALERPSPRRLAASAGDIVSALTEPLAARTVAEVRGEDAGMRTGKHKMDETSSEH
jgi:hypothetical protein